MNLRSNIDLADRGLAIAARPQMIDRGASQGFGHAHRPVLLPQVIKRRVLAAARAQAFTGLVYLRYGQAGIRNFEHSSSCVERDTFASRTLSRPRLFHET
jgi:hypothetical protein